MTTNEDISIPFEGAEKKTFAVENIIENAKYLTILLFSQYYTHLDTCPKYHPCRREGGYRVVWSGTSTHIKVENLGMKKKTHIIYTHQQRCIVLAYNG